MDELSRKYRGIYVEQKEIVKERLIATVVDSLDSLSEVVCAQLLSIAESYPHATGNQANQQLMQAQNIVQEAGRVYGQQLASTLTLGLNSLNIFPSAAISIVSNQPTADASISSTQPQVNASTNQSNDANEDSDDDEMSVKSEINSEDECLSDSDSQPEVDVKEEPEETQTETEINQTDDTATVKDEIVSSSECESDSDSDDYESDSMQVKEEDQDEDEIRFVQNSHNQGPVADGSSNEESENIPDVNVETVDSNEGNNEHYFDGMLMVDDEENVDDESQEEPTITVVNYEEEFQAQFIDNSHNQNFLAGGSLDEETENVSQQQGIGNTVDFHMNGSNEGDNEHSSGQEVLDDQENSIQASHDQGDQAGPSHFSNPVSTVTRRPTRAPASKKVNGSEAMEYSVTDQQQGTLTGTRKRKRSNGRSRKSTAQKRTRVVHAPTVAPTAEEVAESEVEDGPEPEAISLSILVRRLKCHVPGCKKVFPGKVQLDAHHLTKHAIEKYACKVKDCTESYATRGELTTHRNFAHGNLDNDWPCGQCEVTCTSYQDLYKHVYFYHEYGQFACSADKCDFTEKTRVKVNTHQFKHRPAKYHCTFAGCSSSFNHKSHLTTHLRTHTKEQPFLCSQCPKAFTQKHHLTVHERIHSGLKPYSCTWPHCDYSASDQSTAIKHIRGVHFGLPQTKTEQVKRGIIDDRDPKLFVKKTTTPGN